MRKFIFVFFLTAAALSLKAQDSYNFSRYGIGFSTSYMKPFDDLKKANNTFSVSLTGYYNVTPYVPIAAELQAGSLSGGSIITDENKRQYDNHYKALVFHLDLGLGQIIEYQSSLAMGIIKDFYVGAGFGFIANNMAFIQRTNLNNTGEYPVGTYTFPGKNSSVNPMIPLRVGYEYKFYNAYAEPSICISIGYTHNFTFGENLDGYTDPPSNFRNNSLDQYRQITIGVRYNFGELIPFNKKINYNYYY